MDQQAKPKRVLKPIRNSDRRLPLAQVPGSAWYHVLSVQYDRPRSDHLEDLGVTPGSKIKVLHNDHKGTLMLKVAQEMVILGRNYSYRTFVQPLQD